MKVYNNFAALQFPPPATVGKGQTQKKLLNLSTTFSSPHAPYQNNARRAIINFLPFHK